MVVWERARTLSNDFKIFNLKKPPMIRPTPECKGWKKPPNDFIKINVDAAVSKGNVGYGAIARDADGFVLTWCYGFATKDIEAALAELEMLTMGLNLASKLNASKIIIESDSAILINKVKKRDHDVTILGRCMQKEWEVFRSFKMVHFNWINRSSNEVVDLLCKLAIMNQCNLNFNLDYPSKIHNVIIQDAIK
ncbi:hypothetical protein CXB51_000961 [Gossypium anomalum]|uniref:RNase H type-1 domain-containing protein n=1 Tax=Gossypium anomalum TaxID=47600 RepID=A0A8J5ZB64_9ROSI|nr:hypothetical protein CXB51_000961 [Gossypium anomalum]